MKKNTCCGTFHRAWRVTALTFCATLWREWNSKPAAQRQWRTVDLLVQSKFHIPCWLLFFSWWQVRHTVLLVYQTEAKILNKTKKGGGREKEKTHLSLTWCIASFSCSSTEWRWEKKKTTHLTHLMHQTFPAPALKNLIKKLLKSMDVSTDELVKYGTGQRQAYVWCACCLRKKCGVCHFFARRLCVVCCRQLSSWTRSLSCYTVPFLYTSAPLRFSLASWALSDGLDTSCMQANSSHHHIHHHVLSQGWESVARWRYSSVRSIVYNNDNNKHFLSTSSHPRALLNDE